MKKRLLSLFIALFLFPMVVSAREVSLKEFNFSEGGYEYFEGVTDTPDGGYVAIGYVNDSAVLVKYDTNDKIVWKEYIVHENYYYPSYTDIDVDKDGNIYYPVIEHSDNGYISRIVKHDKDGKFVDEFVTSNIKARVADPNNYVSYLFVDLEVSDDRIVVVGKKYDEEVWDSFLDGVQTVSDGDIAVALVLDKKFNVLHEVNFDYDYEEDFMGVSFTSDGGFIAVGGTRSNNIDGVEIKYYETVPMAVKYDKDGKEEWRHFNLLDSNIDEKTACYYGGDNVYVDAIENCDGNYVLVGSIPKLTTSVNLQKPKASWDRLEEALGSKYNGLNLGAARDKEEIDYESAAAIVIELDKEGKKVNEYIENHDYDDMFHDIVLLNSCDYLVVGVKGHPHIDVEEDDNGGIESSRPTDESLGNYYSGCLYNYNDARLILLSKDFKVDWDKTYSGSEYDELFNIAPVNGNEFVAVGYLDSDDLKEVELSGKSDALIVRVKITYTITAEKTENGSFVAHNQDGVADVVVEGDYGIITAHPNEGYKVKLVKVVDSKGKDVAVTKNEDGTFSYKIYDDTWVSVTFVKEEIIEVPKTGVYDLLVFGITGMLVLISGYYFVSKKQIFKRI